MEQYCINQKMSVFTFDKNRKSLLIKATVSSLTITGSENVITLEAKIPNLVIVGHLNQIIARHEHSGLSNIIVNGNNNSIIAANPNFNKINNGNNNSLNNTLLPGFNIGSSYTVFNNFQNSNFNINVNRNGNTFTNIADLINRVAGSHNGNGMQQNEEYYNEDEYDVEGYSNEEEEQEEDKDEEEEPEIFTNDGNKPLDTRRNIILDLNEFQYKHANKYVTKVWEKCRICSQNFKGTDIVRQFACGDHIFHQKCLANWLSKSDLCPHCKYDLNKGISKDSTDSLKPKQMSFSK